MSGWWVFAACFASSLATDVVMRARLKQAQRDAEFLRRHRDSLELALAEVHVGLSELEDKLFAEEERVRFWQRGAIELALGRWVNSWEAEAWSKTGRLNMHHLSQVLRDRIADEDCKRLAKRLGAAEGNV